MTRQEERVFAEVSELAQLRPEQCKPICRFASDCEWNPAWPSDRRVL